MAFEIILLLATLISGLIVAFYSVFKRNRKHNSFIYTNAKSFFPILLFIFSFRSFGFEPSRIPSASMKPTLLEGDFILVDKFSHGVHLPIIGKRVFDFGKPKRGDVIVFRGEVNNKPERVIKRVIGLPGDRISYKQKTLYINGKMQEQDYEGYDHNIEPNGESFPVIRKKEHLEGKDHEIFLISWMQDSNLPYADVIVPENSYFVMGDFRDNSHDSRYWGFVSDDKIVGRARMIITSFDMLNKYIRFDRIGQIL